MSLDAPQMIYQVQKLRDMGQDGKHARRTEVHDTIGDLLHKMEKERLQLGGGIEWWRPASQARHTGSPSPRVPS